MPVYLDEHDDARRTRATSKRPVELASSFPAMSAPSSFDAQHVTEFGADTPMKRPGQPDEIAPCYVFLAGAESSYMSGQALHPNGGEVING